MSSSPTTYYPDAPFFPIPTEVADDGPNQIWYFEAVAPHHVSNNSNFASLQLILFAGATLPGSPVPCYATLNGTHVDGTPFAAFLPAPGGARVDEKGGVWEGAASWTRNGDAFEVVFPQGRLTMKAAAITRGHYPTVECVLLAGLDVCDDCD